ncbi:MAG: aminotransferase class [Chloroflexi bacterium]|nr:aminotransferase class [Chloroflexota bacterium]
MVPGTMASHDADADRKARSIDERLAGRMTRLGTETAFEVLAKAQALEAQGRSVIHLEIGEPDFATPTAIVEAGVQALRNGYTHYTPSPGIMPLRRAIADEMRRSRGLDVAPEQVVVTPGAKPILFFVMLALVDEGDEVLCPDPGFPIYESMIRYAGGTVVPVALPESLGFRLDIDGLRKAITSRTKMIIINSPANPTGGVLTPDDLRQIADLAIRHDLLVFSDEIYSQMLYDDTHSSIAVLPGMAERTIVLDGFSKTYAMTGWRLGYGVFPSALVPHINKLMVNSNSCTAAATQMAGIEALTGDQQPVREMLEEFRRRRDVIVNGLNALPGVTCRMPAGAFYAYPNIQGTGMRSGDLANMLLNEAGVATLAGTSFGPAGEGYLRLSYANSIANIQEALARIGRVLTERKAGS